MTKTKQKHESITCKKKKAIIHDFLGGGGWVDAKVVTSLYSESGGVSAQSLALWLSLACGTDMAETTGSPPAEAFVPVNTNVKQCLRSPRGLTTNSAAE